MAHSGRSNRMAKEWNLIPAGTATFTTTATAIVGSLGVEIPGTVIRMIGEYAVTPTSPPAALDEAVVSLGICFVSTDAFTVGATAMPEPSSDAGYPWLFWAQHALYFASSALDSQNRGGVVRRAFDIKSMRKFKPRETLVMIAEYSSAVGAPPITVSSGGARVLLAT